MRQPPIKNSGKASEAKFENCLLYMYGKNVYIHRLQDAQALHGLNGHAVKVGEQPADYIVTVGGRSFYAEVKSSSNETSFPFSCIRANQIAAGKRVRLAGGKYVFFVHNIKSDTFYMLDSAAVERVSKTRSSMKWSELEEWSDYKAFKRRT